MKTTIWLAAFLLLCGSAPCEAQGIFGFGQRAKKRKIMTAQVAALLVYSNQHSKGYAINRDGLSSARAAKNAEFEAHDQYYVSLEQVNPAVNAAQKRNALLDDHARIYAAFTREISWQRQHSGLRNDEINYLLRVAEGIRQRCRVDSTEMQAVSTPGKLKLSDGERLERMDRLLGATKDKLAFTLSFTRRCRTLASARSAQVRDQEQLKKLYSY